MDSRSPVRRAGIVACFIAAIALVGCASKPVAGPTVTTKSKTELAIGSIPDELLRECQRLSIVVPANTVGDLLQDSADAMYLLAVCAARNDQLLRYLKPVVEAERASK